MKVVFDENFFDEIDHFHPNFDESEPNQRHLLGARLRQCGEELRSFHAPPPSHFGCQDHEALSRLPQKIRGKWPLSCGEHFPEPRRRGWLPWVWQSRPGAGDTILSSCAPQRVNPSATTSNRRLSKASKAARSMSRTNMLDITRAPPSVHVASPPQHPCLRTRCAMVAKLVKAATSAGAVRQGEGKVQPPNTRAETAERQSW